MMMIRVLLINTLVAYCVSYAPIFPSIRLQSTKQSLTTLESTKPMVDMSVDDIAARWKVVKYGQGPQGT
jgi:hypothetical protein